MHVFPFQIITMLGPSDCVVLVGKAGFLNDKHELVRETHDQTLKLSTTKTTSRICICLPHVTWVFPKIGVPPNHPLKNRIWNHYLNHPFWWVNPPYFWDTTHMLRKNKIALLLILSFAFTLNIGFNLLALQLSCWNTMRCVKWWGVEQKSIKRMLEHPSVIPKTRSVNFFSILLYW